MQECGDGGGVRVEEEVGEGEGQFVTQDYKSAVALSLHTEPRTSLISFAWSLDPFRLDETDEGFVHCLEVFRAHFARPMIRSTGLFSDPSGPPS